MSDLLIATIPPSTATNRSFDREATGYVTLGAVTKRINERNERPLPRCDDADRYDRLWGAFLPGSYAWGRSVVTSEFSAQSRANSRRPIGSNGNMPR